MHWSESACLNLPLHAVLISNSKSCPDLWQQKRVYSFFPLSPSLHLWQQKKVELLAAVMMSDCKEKRHNAQPSLRISFYHTSWQNQNTLKQTTQHCLLLSWWVTAKRGEGAQRTQAVTSVAWVIFLSHILTTSKHSETNPSCLTWVRGGEKPYNCDQCNYWSGTLKKYLKTKDT